MNNKTEKKNQRGDFSFVEAVKSVTADINSRARDILAKRFGFGEKKGLTLSQIGDEYGITRERVRQIIQESLNKVKKKAKTDELFQKAEEIARFTVESEYGIIAKEELKRNVLAEQEKEYNFVDFIVHCSEELSEIALKGKIREAVVLNDFDLSRWEHLHSVAGEILKKKNEAIKTGHFFKEFSQESEIDFAEDEFLSYLRVSENIQRNVFDKWGLREWREISPKGTRQKAYLVMKEIGRPLHFREVADLIYKLGLNKKEAHPQTVHNELIKDDKFVLVGRGIYALKEWGYRSGTVKDVIENILKSKQNPVHRDEIVKEVLSVRDVKKATVIINLNNFFEKRDSRLYALKKNNK